MVVESVPQILQCPVCHQPSDSIKRYTFFNLAVFVLVYAFWQTTTLTACPSCMRRRVAIRAAINIIPANFIWVLVVLPWHAVVFLMTYGKGHSRRVLKQIAQAQAQAAQAQRTATQ